MRRVCCWAPRGQDPQRRPPGALQHGVQQQMRAVSRCRLTQEAEHRLVEIYRQFTLTMGGLDATFTPHETKLTLTDQKLSQRQLLRRLWRRRARRGSRIAARSLLSDTALRGVEEPRMYSVRPRYCRELPRDRATRRTGVSPCARYSC